MLELTIKNFDTEKLQESYNSNDEVKLVFDNEITPDDLIKTLDYTFNYENGIARENNSIEDESQHKRIPNILLNTKQLDDDKITKVFKHILTRYDIINSSAIINILNIIKTYNSFDDSFFENDFIFVSNLESLLNIKLEIDSEIKEFIKNLSIWFLSLFKSINKIEYTFLDEHQDLPMTFKRLFQITDLVTISGIINKSPEFSSNELKTVDNAMYYVQEFCKKNLIGNKLLEMFLNDNSEGQQN